MPPPIPKELKPPSPPAPPTASPPRPPVVPVGAEPAESHFPRSHRLPPLPPGARFELKLTVIPVNEAGPTLAEAATVTIPGPTALSAVAPEGRSTETTEDIDPTAAIAPLGSSTVAPVTSVAAPRPDST